MTKEELEQCQKEYVEIMVNKWNSLSEEQKLEIRKKIEKQEWKKGVKKLK